jgi:hypothetical protein
MSSTPPLSQSVPDVGVRVLYMALFAVVFWLLCWALAVIAVAQLVLRLTAGHPNSELARVGAGLGVYARQIIDFLTFASETVPYPFTAWPAP